MTSTTRRSRTRHPWPGKPDSKVGRLRQPVHSRASWEPDRPAQCRRISRGLPPGPSGRRRRTPGPARRWCAASRGPPRQRGRPARRVTKRNVSPPGSGPRAVTRPVCPRRAGGCRSATVVAGRRAGSRSATGRRASVIALRPSAPAGSTQQPPKRHEREPSTAPSVARDPDLAQAPRLASGCRTPIRSSSSRRVSPGASTTPSFVVS